MIAAFGDQRLDADLAVILALGNGDAPIRRAPAATLPRWPVSRRVMATTATAGMILLTGTMLLIGRNAPEGASSPSAKPAERVAARTPAAKIPAAKASVPVFTEPAAPIATAAMPPAPPAADSSPTLVAAASRPSRKIVAASAAPPRAYAVVPRAASTEDTPDVVTEIPASAVSPRPAPSTQVAQADTPPAPDAVTVQAEPPLPSRRARRDTIATIQALRRQ